MRNLERNAVSAAPPLRPARWRGPSRPRWWRCCRSRWRPRGAGHALWTRWPSGGREHLEDDPEQLLVLGLPLGCSPFAATRHRVFGALGVAVLERAVGQLPAGTGVGPTEPLAVDGKRLRGVHGAGLLGEHLVSTYTDQAGVVLAQARARLARGTSWRRSGRLVTAGALLASAR